MLLSSAAVSSAWAGAIVPQNSATIAATVIQPVVRNFLSVIPIPSSNQFNVLAISQSHLAIASLPAAIRRTKNTVNRHVCRRLRQV